jgi:hypothetical protein
LKICRVDRRFILPGKQAKEANRYIKDLEGKIAVIEKQLESPIYKPRRGQ